MRKLIIAGIIVLAVAAVIIVAFVNLNGIVNRNKEYILSRVEESIGREVSVGEIGISFRGGIGVRLRDVALADDPAFSGEPFIAAAGLQVNARLWPLLRKRFEVKRAVLHSPAIRIIRNEAGVFNFASMIRSAQPAQPAVRTGDGGGSQPPAPLLIALIDLDGGTVTYEDRQANRSFSATNVDTRVENLDWREPLRFEMQAAVFSDQQNIRVRGSAKPDGENRSIDAVPVDVDIEITPTDIARVMAALPALTASMPGDLSVTGMVGAGVRAEGTLPSLRASGTLNGTSLAVERAGQFTKPAGTPLVLEFEAHRDGDRIVIDKSDVDLAAVHLSGTGSIRTAPDLFFELDLGGEDIDLSTLQTMVPQAEPYALTGRASLKLHAERSGASGKPAVRATSVIKNGGAAPPQLTKPVKDLNATVTVDGLTASVTNAALKIGNSAVTGTVKAESLVPLRAAYEIDSPELALSDLRPPNPAARKPEKLVQLVVAGRMQIDDGTPVNTGNISAAGGSIANIDFSTLAGRFTVKGKEAKLEQVSLETMGGTVSGSGTALLGEDGPSFTIKSNIKNAAVSQLLGVVPRLEKNPLVGTVNLDATISGRGAEWETMKHSINATGLTEILNGKIREFNFIDRLFADLKQYPGLSNIITNRIQEKYPRAFKTNDTEFRNWNSDFVVEEGKLKARNLVLKAHDYTVRGQGFIDFDKLLDLNITLFLNPALTNDLTGEVALLNYFVNKQGELEVPLRLSGTLPRVSVTPDQQYIQQTLQKGLMQQGVDKLKNKGLNDLLNKLKKPN